MSTTETGPGAPATAEDRGEQYYAALAHVGERVRSARQSALLTQEMLADTLGVTQTAVSYWEAGKRDMGVADLLRIAEACRAPASSLLPLEHQGRAAPTSSLPPPVTDFGPVRLELMGHRYREGNLSETVIAGTPFLRLDLEGGGTEFYAPSSVYCISPGMTPPPVPRAAIPARFGVVADDDDDDTWSDDDD